MAACSQEAWQIKGHGQGRQQETAMWQSLPDTIMAAAMCQAQGHTTKVLRMRMQGSIPEAPTTKAVTVQA